MWEMWFLTGLTGLPDYQVGFFIKMHHAIADGVAGVATLGAFVDPVADPPDIKPPPWTPARLPTTRELFRDNLHRRLGELDRTLSAVAKPITTARGLLRSWPAAREIFAEGRAPRTSVNRMIGSDRRLYAWGLNSEGEVGDGTTTERPKPVRVKLPAGVKPIRLIGLRKESNRVAFTAQHFAVTG